MANTLAALGVGGASSFLAQATLLAQAKNYSGTGKWFDEITGTGYFTPGSVLGANIAPYKFGGANALVLNGVTGNYGASADASPLDITGDITIVSKASLPDYSPATQMTYVSKWTNGGGAGTCSYMLRITTGGLLRLSWSPTGAEAGVVSQNSTTAVPFADRDVGYVAATLDVDNGASGYDVKFWTSTDGVTWTQLGTTVVGGATTSIANSTINLRVGIYSASEPLTGDVFRTTIYSGIRDLNAGTGGTLAFDANFEAQATGTTSFTESSSNAATVTINSTGADTNDPQWLPWSTSQNPFGASTDYVYGSGIADNWVSTPDTGALDITGDITLLIRYRPIGSWSPASTHYPFAKYQDSNNISYGLFFSTSSNIPRLRHSANGSTAIDTLATTGVPFNSNTTGWVAVTLDVDDGAGNRVVKFWTSSTNTNDPDAASWTQLGTTVTTSGTTSIFNSTSKLGVLGYLNGAITSGGFCSRAQVYNGVRDFSGTPSGGTLVADFNPAGGTINSTGTSLTGTGDGLTWTINQTATGRQAFFIDRDSFLFGTDDYMSMLDNANLDFAASQDFTLAVSFRARQAADSSYHYLLSKRDLGGTQVGYAIGEGGTGVTEEFFGLTDAGATGAIIYDSSWNNPNTLQTHIFTRTAGATGTLTIYTDGVSVGGAGAEGGDLSTALALLVGRGVSSGAGTLYYDGLIHSVAIFRRGLTAAEVTQLDQELKA